MTHRTYFDINGNFTAPPVTASTPVITVSASGAAQALTVPAQGDRAYDIVLTANCALSLTGGSAGVAQTVHLWLRQAGGGGFTPALPAGVKWPVGGPPVPGTAAGQIDVYKFTTLDGGATFTGERVFVYGG